MWYCQVLMKSSNIMCNSKKRLLFILTFCMLSLFGIAQNDINSPYSSFGLGNLSRRSNAVLSSMGGVGYAMQNPYYINFKNPAAFFDFDSLSFIADLAFTLNNQNMRTKAQSYNGTYAQLDYIAIGLPVLPVWRTSAGIMPFSDVGYGILDERNDIEHFGKVTYEYKGNGGLQLLYWGNAFKVLKKLTLGINLSYLFGTIHTTSFTQYDDKETPYTFNSMISNFRYVDGIQITGGLQYHTMIHEKHHICLGTIFENAVKVWSRENFIALNYMGQYSASSTSFDTVIYKVGKDAWRSSVKMPHIVGGGFTYEYKDKVLTALDITWQNWKRFSMEKSIQTSKDSLKNNFIAAIGVQYTPNALSSKYYNKINFRAGARFSSGYIVIHNHPISEFSVSVGLGLPIPSQFNIYHSSVNIMLEYSRLGTIKYDLISHDYFKLTFNFIFQEKWYQRRKLD